MERANPAGLGCGVVRLPGREKCVLLLSGMNALLLVGFENILHHRIVLCNTTHR